MQTADKAGHEMEKQREPKSGFFMASRTVCPDLNVAFLHLGGCFFAATMLGAAVYGVWGGLIGACLGLLLGALAAFSKDR